MADGQYNEAAGMLKEAWGASDQRYMRPAEISRKLLEIYKILEKDEEYEEEAAEFIRSAETL